MLLTSLRGVFRRLLSQLPFLSGFHFCLDFPFCPKVTEQVKRLIRFSILSEGHRASHETVPEHGTLRAAAQATRRAHETLLSGSAIRSDIRHEMGARSVAGARNLLKIKDRNEATRAHWQTVS